MMNRTPDMSSAGSVSVRDLDREVRRSPDHVDERERHDDLRARGAGEGNHGLDTLEVICYGTKQ